MTQSTVEQDTSADISTLVFLHGSGDNAHVWDRVTAALPAYTCRALDLPGHGELIERPGPEQMSAGDYADVVRSMLTRERLSDVCLVGHSLGGAIALRLAVDHPALVSRLVLVGTGARLRVLPEVLEAARTLPKDAHTQLTEHGFAPGHKALAATYLETLAPTAPGMLYRDLAACDSFDMREELGHVSQPTLVIVGEADRLTPPKYAHYLQEHLADAELVTIPDAGHYLTVEAPQAIAQAITRWLPE